MSRLNFCWPLGYPLHTYAELDGYAEITDHGTVEEIFLPDYADRPVVHVSVAGPLFAEIERWLKLERRREIDEAAEEARLGRVAADRNLFRRAAE